MRDNEHVITHNSGFSWLANPKKTFLIATVQILVKIGKNLTKIAITSAACDISMQFDYEIGFQLSANSSVTLPYTRDKGVLPWKLFLGLK